MDEFKKYLFDHRDEMDVEKTPGLQVWQHIEANTSPVTEKGATSKTRSVTSKIVTMGKWLAAAMLGGVIVLLVDVATKEDTSTIASTPSSDSSASKQMAGRVEEQRKQSAIRQGEADGQTVLNPQKELAKPPPSSVETGRSSRKKRVTESPKSQDDMASTGASSNAETAISPLQDMEDCYTAVINHQVKKIESIPIYGEDANYFHVFKKQWYDLNKDEQKIKHDLAYYGLNEEIVDQLLQLYQQKLGLLKSLQTEIQKLNIRARHYPPNSMDNPTYFKL